MWSHWFIGRSDGSRWYGVFHVHVLHSLIPSLALQQGLVSSFLGQQDNNLAAGVDIYSVI